MSFYPKSAFGIAQHCKNKGNDTNHDVFGLEVSVDDTTVVKMRHPLRYLQGHVRFLMGRDLHGLKTNTLRQVGKRKGVLLTKDNQTQERSVVSVCVESVS